MCSGAWASWPQYLYSKIPDCYPDCLRESLQNLIMDKIKYDGHILGLPRGHDLSWKNIESTEWYWPVPAHEMPLNFKKLLAKKAAKLFETTVQQKANMWIEEVIEKEGIEVLRKFCQKPVLELSIKFGNDNGEHEDNSAEK